jgi:hypothetical protein
MLRKILIMGLPSAGKTTLARILAPRLNAVHFNADEVRAHINKDLGFSELDRLEQARRMGWLCDQVVKTGGFVIADFVCPTPATRTAFMEGGNAFIVWVDRVKAGPFQDTNRLFVSPEHYDMRITPDGSAEYWAEEIVNQVRPFFDPKRPTALFLGRFQPFHDDHKSVISEGLQRVGQACIAVRAPGERASEDCFDFQSVRAHIEHALRPFEGKFVVVQMPNISRVFCGRNLEYPIEKIDLDEANEFSADIKIKERSGNRARSLL